MTLLHAYPNANSLLAVEVDSIRRHFSHSGWMLEEMVVVHASHVGGAGASSWGMTVQYSRCSIILLLMLSATFTEVSSTALELRINRVCPIKEAQAAYHIKYV